MPCVGRAATVELYAMFAAGVPFVHPGHSRVPILGEVFEVPTGEGRNTLTNLDRLEGHPDWYVRTPISVVLTDGPRAGETVAAEIYFNSKCDDSNGEYNYIPSGDFRDSEWGPSVKKFERTEEFDCGIAYKILIFFWLI